MGRLDERPDLAPADHDGGVRAHQRELARAAVQGRVDYVQQSVNVWCGSETR